MSRVIDHGYRLAPGLDPFDLVERVRAEMDPRRTMADARHLVTEAVDLLDRARWGLGQVDSPLADAIAKTVREARVLRRTERRNEWRRFGLRLLRDPQEGRLFALADYEETVYGERPLATIHGLEHWPYWDNTDRPDTIHEQEWSTRRDTWERVLPWDHAPAALRFDLREGPVDGLFESVDRSQGGRSRVADVLRVYSASSTRVRRVALESCSQALGAAGEHLGVEEVMDLGSHVTEDATYRRVVAAHLRPVTVEELCAPCPGLSGSVPAPVAEEATRCGNDFIDRCRTR